MLNRRSGCRIGRYLSKLKSYYRGSRGLSADLLAKFALLWAGKYDSGDLDNDLGDGVIEVTLGEAEAWTSKYIPDTEATFALPDDYEITNGYLYNRYALTGLAPTGWHVPTAAEWTALETYLIAEGYNYDDTTEGNKIGKSLAATTGWAGSATEGAVGNTDYPAKRNASGFSARGSGSYVNGDFNSIAGTRSQWWSSSAYGGSYLYIRNLTYDRVYFTESWHDHTTAISVRLLRDNLTGYVEGETVTDIDGNIYDTVQIGDQVWMLQNYACTKLADGTPITKITDMSEWSGVGARAYCSFDNDDTYAIIGSNWIAADASDEFWFDSDGVQQQKTFDQLIGTSTTRTFVKYTNKPPYRASIIGILKPDAVLTDDDKEELTKYFKLWVYYWEDLWDDKGQWKDNRDIPIDP